MVLREENEGCKDFSNNLGEDTAAEAGQTETRGPT
jgi:hypothetical protein